jgi:hypothetical protein
MANFYLGTFAVRGGLKPLRPPKGSAEIWLDTTAKATIQIKILQETSGAQDLLVDSFF